MADQKSDLKKPLDNIPQEPFKRPDLIDSCFDIKYARNLLVLITNFPEIKLDLLQDQEFSNKNYFLILGIVVNEKSNLSETQKIATLVQMEPFGKFFKKDKTEWLEVNMLPLEKLTTFQRFFWSFIKKKLFL